MNIRRLTSMLMLFSSLVLIYTGVFLFISPPGRVANWALWSLGGLTKEQHESLHIVFVLLFLTSFVLHIFYNYKPILQYMKNKAQKLVVFTPETSVALALCVLFGIGALVERGPLHAFLGWGDEISYAWEKQFGTAPYGHAELSSLEEFTKRLGFDLENSVQSLRTQGITVDSTETTLARIARVNGISPEAVFMVIKKAHAESLTKAPLVGAKTDSPDMVEILPITGLGRMTLGQACEIHGVDSHYALRILQEKSPEINLNMLMRQIASLLEKSPEEVLNLLQK